MTPEIQWQVQLGRAHEHHRYGGLTENRLTNSTTGHPLEPAGSTRR